MATWDIIDEWHSGKLSGHFEITRTNLRGSISQSHFQLADLSCARLAWADLTDANLEGAILCKADLGQATLNRTDLKSAYLDGASLESTRIIDADLGGASLKGVSLPGAFISPQSKLHRAKWDEKYISPLEVSGDYGAAIEHYRYLSEWHDLAGMRRVAGEFHYRQREAERKAHWESIGEDLRASWHRLWNSPSKD